MATDNPTKRIEYLTNSDDLTKVANAIRSKGGTTDPLVYPDGFEAAILAIPSGTGTPVDVRLNAITIDRYHFIPDDQKTTLDLSGLITGNYFICYFGAAGIQKDRGESIDIVIQFQSMGPNFYSGRIYGQGIFMHSDDTIEAAPIIAYLESGSDHVYDISENFGWLTDSEGNFVANCTLDQARASYVVSWN